MRFRPNSFYRRDTTRIRPRTSIHAMNSGPSTGTSTFWIKGTGKTRDTPGPSVSRVQHPLVMPYPIASRSGSWLEFGFCVLGVVGVLASILPGFHPREWQASGSDLKTLYASTACFRTHIDAYSFTNIAAVFNANRVVPPESWYAHAPVYPPFTLAAIAPLTFLPMVGAVYVWLIVASLAWAFATYSLVRAAEASFHISLPWRTLLIAFAAASPLASFSLEMGNVSAVVAALCIAAVAMPRQRWSSLNLRALALCLGLLLKPHLAIWFVVALLISQARKDRAIGARALGFFVLACLAVVSWMGAHHILFAQVESYRAMVAAETHGGSMAASNDEFIAVAAQITSLASLLGYWIHSKALAVLAAAGLAVCAALLVAATWPRADDDDSSRLLRFAAWSAFGLIATYHRAHDGIVLLVLLPYVVARLRTSWHDWFAWSYLLLSLAAGLGPPLQTINWLASTPGIGGAARFLAYRQSSLAFLLLLLLVVAQAYRRQTHATQIVSDRDEEMYEEQWRAAS